MFNEENKDREMPFFGQETMVAAAKNSSLKSKEYILALEQCRDRSRRLGINAIMDRHDLDALVAPSGDPAWLIDLKKGDSNKGWSSTPAAVAGYPHITQQANKHATASSEVAWLDGLNHIWNSWVCDERTILAIRNGFESFEALSKSDQAIFQTRVGTLVNHWVLASELASKGLISPNMVDEVTKIVISVLSTQGGLEYWEYDSKATPGGVKLLQMVKDQLGQNPTWIELMPWWAPDID